MTKSQYELKKLMKIRLKEMQIKNPQFSLRAFARSLDVHAASLSEFFNDKRHFSRKLQKKIIQALNIDPEKKQHLLALVETEQEEVVDLERIQLDSDSYYIVSDPIYYSILCLVETANFKENVSWIAGRLNTTEEKVQEALDCLLRIGYIKRVGDKLTVSEVHLATTSDVASMSLRFRHAENMDSAKVALMNLPVEQRYFRFETLAIDMEQMPEFKKAAQQFLDKILAISQISQKKDEVYEFTLGFFPRTVKEIPCPKSMEQKIEQIVTKVMKKTTQCDIVQQNNK